MYIQEDSYHTETVDYEHFRKSIEFLQNLIMEWSLNAVFINCKF